MVGDSFLRTSKANAVLATSLPTSGTRSFRFLFLLSSYFSFHAKVYFLSLDYARLIPTSKLSSSTFHLEHCPLQLMPSYKQGSAQIMGCAFYGMWVSQTAA